MSFPSSDHIAEIMTFSQQYRRAEAQRIFILCVLGALLCAAFLLDLPAGQSSMTPIDTVRGLFAQDQLKPSHALILWQVRLPDALIALAVGASLGPACIEILTVLNNALANPSTFAVGFVVFIVLIGLVGANIARLMVFDLARRYCDKIGLLNHGKIVAMATPAEIITKENLAANYRVDGEGKHDPSSHPLIEIHNPLKKEIIHEKVCC